MEQKMENKAISTKDGEQLKTVNGLQKDGGETLSNPALSGVFLSHADAEEYRTYKKRKKLTELSSAIARSESTLMGGEDIQRACERAVRLRQAAVKTPLSKISQAAFYLSGSGVKLDCVVGGTGETLAKVKAYETKLAVRKAKEISLILTPSYLDGCRYGEIRREIKRVRRAAKKADVKVCVQKAYSPTVLARIARICSEMRVKFFSVPYFNGCERLRMDLMNGCQLEVVGVETGTEYRRLISAGIGRIVTERAWEIYTDWLREANEIPLPPVQAQPPQTLQNRQPAQSSKAQETQGGASGKENGTGNVPSRMENRFPSSSETNYRCRLEGTQLKFL